MFATITLGACADNTFDGEVLPNGPPDTRITAAPPILGASGATVTLAWSGFDADGVVARFEWRISDNGRDGAVDVADTLGLTWHATAVSDSVFTVSADLDSFPPDVDDPRQQPGDYRAWQTHTFFVRAVDDRGAVDPTPAHVSFTATTLAPTIAVDIPPPLVTNACVRTNLAPTYHWVAHDPDGIDGPTSAPAAVRTLWWEVPDCWTEARFEQDNPLPGLPESAWSPWVAYDAPQDAGRSLALPQQQPGKIYFFAVQARDRAGAVTPTFEWGVNVRHVQIDSSMRPTLDVFEPFFGRFSIARAQDLYAFDLAPRQPAEFRFAADASAYYGVVTAYRYGWDVVDPNDPADPGWAVDWGMHSHAGPIAFASGSHNFVVQARDNAGAVARAVFQLGVLPAPPRSNQRPLLLVKDGWSGVLPEPLLQLYREWDARWAALLDGLVSGFDPDVDMVNAEDAGAFSLWRFLQYRAVLYFGKGSSSTTMFHSLLAPADGTGLLRYNWFEVYQATYGNVLFTGPGSMYGSIEQRVTGWRFPIVFDAPEDFGLYREPGAATSYPAGRLRYPYRAFCLEAIDMVRPSTPVYGETPGASGQRRTAGCDAIARALVEESFVAANPSAGGQVLDFLPNADRGQNFLANLGAYQFAREEFYNTNRSTREVTLRLRPCQQTMYRLLARRDDGWIVRPDTVCVPRESARSTLDQAPIGIASTAYASTKPLAGAPDFLWGFHPLAFQPAEVRSALRWILQEAWQLPAP